MNMNGNHCELPIIDVCFNILMHRLHLLLMPALCLAVSSESYIVGVTYV